MQQNTPGGQESKFVRARCLFGFLILAPLLAVAGYKAKNWLPGPPEDFASRLTSEGVTIAAKPFFRDDLAAQVFDKKDIVTRGIMPLAVIVFNHNEYPIEVNGPSIRVLHQADRLRTMEPREVLARLFEKRGKGFQIPFPIPKSRSADVDRKAVEDFEQKFLSDLIVPPNSSRAGFLFFRIPDTSVENYLLNSRIYIPEVYNRATGKALIYFEIDLRAAIEAARQK